MPVSLFLQGYYECDHIEYNVINMAMMYEDSEWTKRHSHFPSDFAACYYVDVEPVVLLLFLKV